MLSNIIENSSEVILSIDKNGMIIYANKAVKKVFGWTVEDVLGKNLFLFSHHGWKLMQNNIMENAKKQDKKTIESIWLHKNGTTIPVIVTITPFYDSMKKQQIFNVIAVDISQVKKLEDSLKSHSLNFELLRNIMNIRDKAKNIDEMLESRLYTVLNSLDFTGGAIYLVDKQQEEAILQKSLGLSKDFVEQAKSLQINDHRFKKIFIKGEMLLIEDFTNVNFAHTITGVQSIIAFPLILDDNVIGALFLALKEKRTITKDDKWIIETISIEISNAVTRFTEYKK